MDYITVLFKRTIVSKLCKHMETGIVEIGSVSEFQIFEYPACNLFKEQKQIRSSRAFRGTENLLNHYELNIF